MQKKSAINTDRFTNKSAAAFPPLFFIACVLLCPCTGAPISLAKGTQQVKGVFSLTLFRRIVVLDNGRAKPLDTYARNLLMQFSGKMTFGGAPAAAWLARTILAPQSAGNDKVLFINDPQIANAIGITHDRRRRYSIDQITPGMQKLEELSQAALRLPAQQRSTFDSEIIHVADNVIAYVNLLHALHFTLSIPQLGVFAPAETEGDDTLQAQSAPLWNELSATYKAGDQDSFDSIALRLAAVITKLSPSIKNAKDPRMEILYNTIDPFAVSKILYALGLLFCVLFMTVRFRRAVLSGREMYGLSIALVSTGFILHTLGIIGRVAILERPPVATLYETFVFVGWMVVLLGCITEFIQRRGWGLALSAAAGLALLHVAGKFSLEGDTMGMLAAILNSNFWLTTHVITIACGYAGCVAAGLLGHVSLLRGLFSSKPAFSDTSIDRCVYGIMAFGFAGTVIGTVLGGLWADQAWGRFWGWDPKENGALLIILWCAVLFHLRSEAAIKRRGFAVGSVIGLVLVMFAWIGVNLLGIGMHAYGFTAMGARLLFIVTSVETLFLAGIGAGYWFVKERGEKSS